MGWRALVQAALRRAGYEMVRWPLPAFLEAHGIDTVLDVGANRGQYALELRNMGYTGRIVSFEPLSAAFGHLASAAAGDERWTAVQLALGAEASESVIHVAGNSASSSLLDMLPKHSEVAPESATVGEEIVRVERLDSVFDHHVSPDSTVFLKIDTQGFERQVLEGAAAVMPRVKGLQMEMSLEPLYQGESLAEDLIAFVRKQGFTPAWVGHGLKDPSDLRLLQLDGIFFRL